MRASRSVQTLSDGLRYATIVSGATVWLWSLPGIIQAARPIQAQIGIISILVILTGYKSFGIPLSDYKLDKHPEVSTSISDVLIIFSAFVYGPEAAVFVAGLDGFFAGRNVTKRISSWLFNLALLPLSTAAAMAAFRTTMIVVHGTYVTGLSVPFSWMALPLSAFMVVHFSLNTTILCMVLSLRHGKSIWQNWRHNYMWMAVNSFPAASAAGLMYLCVQKFGWTASLIGIPIVVLVHFSYRQHGKNAEERVRHAEEINRTHLATIEALATAIDAKDQTTSGHVRRTQTYAIETGKTIGMTEAEIEAVKAAAVLHDVGKIAIPEYILNKPGRLTDEEFAIMKTHVLVGAEILRGVNFPYPVIPAVKHHHEKYNGSGYPDGLKGEEIPIAARVLSVVDVYDALMQDRPYRKGLPKEKVIDMMKRDAGSHFDPRVVEVFFANIDRLEEMVKSLEPEEERPPIAVDYSTKYPVRREVEPDKLVYSNKAHSDLSASYRELLSLRTILDAEFLALTREDAITILLSKLPRIIPHDTSSIFLFSPEKGHLCAEFCAGRDSSILRGREIKPNEGVSGWAFVNRKPLHNTNPAFDLEGANSDLANQYRGVASTPLIDGERVLGVLTIYSRDIDHYTDDHLALFHKVAACATEIFESATAQAADRGDANVLVNAQTGIANQQALEQYWAQEALLSERSHRPISLLHLELRATQAGEEAGPHTLQAIGQLLRSELRGSDFVGQISPSSLAAVLTGIDLGSAGPVAERVARGIEQYRAAEGGGFWDFDISILNGSEIDASGRNLLQIIEDNTSSGHESTHLADIPPPALPVSGQEARPIA